MKQFDSDDVIDMEVKGELMGKRIGAVLGGGLSFMLCIAAPVVPLIVGTVDVVTMGSRVGSMSGQGIARQVDVYNRTHA